jgi:hypothetical protein
VHGRCRGVCRQPLRRGQVIGHVDVQSIQAFAIQFAQALGAELPGQDELGLDGTAGCLADVGQQALAQLLRAGQACLVEGIQV